MRRRRERGSEEVDGVVRRIERKEGERKWMERKEGER